MFFPKPEVARHATFLPLPSEVMASIIMGRSDVVEIRLGFGTFDVARDNPETGIGYEVEY